MMSAPFDSLLSNAALPFYLFLLPALERRETSILLPLRSVRFSGMFFFICAFGLLEGSREKARKSICA